MVANEEQWDYSPEKGPEHWKDLSQDFAQASQYPYQSPISLVHEKTSKFEKQLELHYQVADFYEKEIFPTTHLVPANRTNFILLEDGPFYLTDIHFHKPSEHLIDHLQEDIEFHFVHQNEKQEVVVLGVLFHLNDDKTQFYNKMTEKDWDLSEMKHTFDPGSFFSDQAHFFQYLGSLTTPPTNGPVQWFVFDGVGEMSRKFLTNFHLHVKQNARPLQALNQRNICWGNLSN